MLHLSSEQTGINGFQFMHTSYQRKNFIYYLADQSCKVLIAFPECPLKALWKRSMKETSGLMGSVPGEATQQLTEGALSNSQDSGKLQWQQDWASHRLG